MRHYSCEQSGLLCLCQPTDGPPPSFNEGQTD